MDTSLLIRVLKVHRRIIFIVSMNILKGKTIDITTIKCSVKSAVEL